jgi:type II restriction enzyme
MSISANRGEHSELLAFLRILHEGRVQVADKFGEPREAWLKVSGIQRPSDPDRSYQIVGDQVIVMSSAGAELARASRASVGALADKLFLQIKESEGASFVCPAGDEAFLLLRLEGAKAGSAAKADLLIEVASPVFDGEVLSLGFSVKSELGGLPTLLNAGSTQFEYRIEGCSAVDA